METILIPVESEIKQWLKEAIQEYFDEESVNPILKKKVDEKFESRKEIADFLDISLTTLHSWVNRGLPSHKKRGRVYFLRLEVMDHIKIQ